MVNPRAVYRGYGYDDVCRERIPPSGMYRTATGRNVSSSDQSGRYAISPGREWLSRERLGVRRGSSPIETLIPGSWHSSCEQRDKVTVDKRKATIKRRQSLKKHVRSIDRGLVDRLHCLLVDSEILRFLRTKGFTSLLNLRAAFLLFGTDEVLVFFFRIN